MFFSFVFLIVISADATKKSATEETDIFTSTKGIQN
jgi:hypothetical protein